MPGLVHRMEIPVESKTWIESWLPEAWEEEEWQEKGRLYQWWQSLEEDILLLDSKIEWLFLTIMCYLFKMPRRGDCVYSQHMIYASGDGCASLITTCIYICVESPHCSYYHLQLCHLLNVI
jgi:hypothetical protein